MVALLIFFLVGSVPKVDISGAANKKCRLQVLDCKLCLEDLFLFQVPIHCRYLVELYTSYPMITMIISSQLQNYGGQVWMSCISGGTSYRLSGKFSCEGLSLWGGEEKKCDFRFWIESDAWRVSFCFRFSTIKDYL